MLGLKRRSHSLRDERDDAKDFAKGPPVSHSDVMTQPLALVTYENLLPGSQLANRMQDLGYRVTTVADAARLVEQAAREKPMLVVADLFFTNVNICELITALRKNPDTAHIPVLAFTSAANEKLQEAGRIAGAKIVATEDAMLHHLPQLLEQVLSVE